MILCSDLLLYESMADRVAGRPMACSYNASVTLYRRLGYREDALEVYAHYFDPAHWEHVPTDVNDVLWSERHGSALDASHKTGGMACPGYQMSAEEYATEQEMDARWVQGKRSYTHVIPEGPTP